MSGITYVIRKKIFVSLFLNRYMYASVLKPISYSVADTTGIPSRIRNTISMLTSPTKEVLTNAFKFFHCWFVLFLFYSEA